MEASLFSDRERTTLLSAFRDFRAHDDESDYRGYAHRDALENKLQEGGDIDEMDLHLLSMAVANERDQATYNAFMYVFKDAI